jgi:hypothetical protein
MTKALSALERDVPGERDVRAEGQRPLQRVVVAGPTMEDKPGRGPGPLECFDDRIYGIARVDDQGFVEPLRQRDVVPECRMLHVGLDPVAVEIKTGLSHGAHGLASQQVLDLGGDLWCPLVRGVRMDTGGCDDPVELR